MSESATSGSDETAEQLPSAGGSEAPAAHIVRVAPRDLGEGRIVRHLGAKLIDVQTRARRDDFLIREVFAWLKTVVGQFFRSS